MLRFTAKLLLVFTLLLLGLLFYSLYEPSIHAWWTNTRTTLNKAADKASETKPVAKVKDWTEKHLPKKAQKEKPSIAQSRPAKSKPRTVASKTEPKPRPKEHISDADRRELEHLIPEN